MECSSTVSPWEASTATGAPTDLNWNLIFKCLYNLHYPCRQCYFCKKYDIFWGISIIFHHSVLIWLVSRHGGDTHSALAWWQHHLHSRGGEKSSVREGFHYSPWNCELIHPFKWVFCIEWQRSCCLLLRIATLHTLRCLLDIRLMNPPSLRILPHITEAQPFIIDWGAQRASRIGRFGLKTIVIESAIIHYQYFTVYRYHYQCLILGLVVSS